MVFKKEDLDKILDLVWNRPFGVIGYGRKEKYDATPVECWRIDREDLAILLKENGYDIGEELNDFIEYLKDVLRPLQCCMLRDSVFHRKGAEEDLKEEIKKLRKRIDKLKYKRKK